MRKIILFCLFSSLTAVLFAQKQNFDLITYTPPKGWKKEVKNGAISYTYIDKKDKTWCQLGIYKSTASKGSIEADFESEWELLVKNQYHPADTPQTSTEKTADWLIKSGSAKYVFNNKETMVLLTTFSGHGVCFSIVATTAYQRYIKAVEDLMSSLELKTPAQKAEPVQTNTANIPKASVPGNYAFTTTNFDDGWKSEAKEDWVEVTKGNVKVLLHYPRQGTIIPADPEPFINNAWNILVAPRYQNLKNYKTAYISEYERPCLGFGYATGIETGNEVYIVLFRKGSSGFIECITPDKNTFFQTFGFDPDQIGWNSESSLLNPLIKLSGYNKFAIAASDFAGAWTSDFTGVQQLYSVYTGQYAGMNINQSSQTFEFGAGNSYNWKILSVNGMVGSMKYGQAKSSGKFSIVNNWQISFSDIEGKPRLYDAYFSCVKGGRILWINDAQNPGSGIFTGFGKQ